MNFKPKNGHRIAGSTFAAVALLLAVGLTGPGCDSVDNFNSQVACSHYCSKNFDCQDKTPTGDESSTCIGKCRNSIEDECGNEHQDAANKKIEECVDKGCADFWACMVFDAAPNCYGFVSQ